MDTLKLIVLCTISMSFGLFYLFNYLFNLFGPPKMLSVSISTENFKGSHSRKFWKYKNVLMSLIHSAITGPFAVLCFYSNERIRTDLISTFTVGSVILVSFSLGYFLNDAFDMIINRPERHQYELIIHHIVIFICFGISVWTQLFVGYALVALLVEVNSIFLHLRQIMGLLAIKKSQVIYRINNILNIGTFIIFRMVTLSWMTRWLVINRNNISLGYYTIGSIGMAIITLMNIVLFYRIIYSDFVKSVSKNKDHVNTYTHCKS